MFGIFNMTNISRDEALRGNESKNKNNDEPCYGGFSSRFDYEDCRNHRPRPAAAFLYIAVLFFIGITASAAGITAYEFVQRNRMLYYPADSVCTEPPEHTKVAPKPSSMDDITLVSVSSDQSVRYRIPRGVMIKVIPASMSSDFSELAAGDIIVAVNDKEINDLDELKELCAESNDSIVFRVFRQNRYIDIAVPGGYKG